MVIRSVRETRRKDSNGTSFVKVLESGIHSCNLQKKKRSLLKETQVSQGYRNDTESKEATSHLNSYKATELRDF